MHNLLSSINIAIARDINLCYYITYIKFVSILFREEGILLIKVLLIFEFDYIQYLVCFFKKFFVLYKIYVKYLDAISWIVRRRTTRQEKPKNLT